MEKTIKLILKESEEWFNQKFSWFFTNGMKSKMPDKSE